MQHQGVVPVFYLQLQQQCPQVASLSEFFLVPGPNDCCGSPVGSFPRAPLHSLPGDASAEEYRPEHYGPLKVLCERAVEERGHVRVEVRELGAPAECTDARRNGEGGGPEEQRLGLARQLAADRRFDPAAERFADLFAVVVSGGRANETGADGRPVWSTDYGARVGVRRMARLRRLLGS